MISEKVKKQIQAGKNPLSVESNRDIIELVNLLSGDQLDLEKCTWRNILSLYDKEGNKIISGTSNQIRKFLATANMVLGTNFDVANCAKRTYCLYSIRTDAPIDPSLLPEEEEVKVEDLISTEIDTVEESLPEIVTAEYKAEEKEPEDVKAVLVLPEGLEEPEWDKIAPVKYSKKALKEYASTFEVELDTKKKYQEMVDSFKEQVYNKYS